MTTAIPSAAVAAVLQYDFANRSAGGVDAGVARHGGTQGAMPASLPETAGVCRRQWTMMVL